MPGVPSRKRSFVKPEPDLDISISNVVEEGVQSTTRGTKAGWCLPEGMPHILKANGSALASIYRQEGEPQDIPLFMGVQNCFQSLCKIVTGQAIAGAQALKVWQKFVETTNENVKPSKVENVTPSKVLELAKISVKDCLQKPSALSLAKAQCIVLLSEAFSSGDLTESF
jgi:3-methyladenine DNA glycosylase/8-oxoguanine DNA glycosylase